MQRSLSFCAVALIALAGCASAPQVPADSAADLDSSNVARLDSALAGDWRSAENRARDQYRHPRETLAFFGVRPEQTVIEITPGNRGAKAIAEGFAKTGDRPEYLGDYGTKLRDDALMIALVHERKLAKPEYDRRAISLGR